MINQMTETLTRATDLLKLINKKLYDMKKNKEEIQKEFVLRGIGFLTTEELYDLYESYSDKLRQHYPKYPDFLANMVVKIELESVVKELEKAIKKRTKKKNKVFK